MNETSVNQPHFWQVSRENQTYTELCNALYEREILRLSSLDIEQLERLPRRLASLPFYIRKTASHILSHSSDLSLDSQNASWYCKQASTCPAQKQQASPIETFYRKYAKLGLIVPIYVTELTHEQIVLDSIDEIDKDGARFHCNQHGWFSFSGAPLSVENSEKFALKPAKGILSAACCGHQWLNGDKKPPRILSLRELLLASRINWQNFAKPLPALTV